MQHVELGKKLMNRIIEDTKDTGKVETHPKFEGKQMIMIIMEWVLKNILKTFQIRSMTR